MRDGIVLFSFVNLGITFLLITLSAILLKINKKKFIIGTIISVIYAGFALYYVFLTFTYPRSVLQKEMSTTPPPPASTTEPITEPSEEEPDFTVIITTEDNTFSLAPDGELEIKKGTKFKIEKVVYPTSNQDEIKADIKGFAGNARYNDLQDIGYWATYNDMIPRFAVKGEVDKYEIQIKKDKDLLGSVYIKFVD